MWFISFKPQFSIIIKIKCAFFFEFILNKKMESARIAINQPNTTFLSQNMTHSREGKYSRRKIFEKENIFATSGVVRGGLIVFG